MSARPIQLYSGVDSVRAANELVQAIQERRDQWPYPHYIPPPNAEDVVVFGAVAVPAPGTTVEVVNYKVSSGKRLYLAAVLLSVTNASTMVPGAATWTVDRNKPVGVANVQGAVEHGLVGVPFPLGDNLTRPWYLSRCREFEPLDVVRIKGTNVALGGETFKGALIGWELPVLDVKPAR